MNIIKKRLYVIRLKYLKNTLFIVLKKLFNGQITFERIIKLQKRRNLHG